MDEWRKTRGNGKKKKEEVKEEEKNKWKKKGEQDVGYLKSSNERIKGQENSEPGIRCNC